MDARAPAPRRAPSYLLKHGTAVVSAEVSEIHERVDVTTLERHPARSLGLNDIGRVTLTAARPLLFDAYATTAPRARFILIDRLTNGTCGAGHDPRAGRARAGEAAAAGAGVTPSERAQRLGQRAAVVVADGPRPRAARRARAHGSSGRLWDDGYTAHVLEARDPPPWPSARGSGSSPSS